jgi:hypothetical protein
MSFKVGDKVKTPDGTGGTISKAGLFPTVEDADGKPIGTFHMSKLKAAAARSAFRVGDGVTIETLGRDGQILNDNEDGTYEVADDNGRSLGSFEDSDLRAAATAETDEQKAEREAAEARIAAEAAAPKKRSLKDALRGLLAAVSGKSLRDLETDPEEESEEAAELISYTTISTLIEQAEASLGQAKAIAAQLVSDEDGEAADKPEDEAAEEEVEEARLSAITTMLSSTINSIYGAMNIVQQEMMEEDEDDEDDNGAGDASGIEQGSPLYGMSAERLAGGPGSGVRGHTTEQKIASHQAAIAAHMAAAAAHKSAYEGHGDVNAARTAHEASVAALAASQKAGKGSYGAAQAAVSHAETAAGKGVWNADQLKEHSSDMPSMTHGQINSHDAMASHNQMVMAHQQAIENLKKKSGRSALGARHNKTDSRMVQEVHDNSVKLGADCPNLDGRYAAEAEAAEAEAAGAAVEPDPDEVRSTDPITLRLQSAARALAKQSKADAEAADESEDASDSGADESEAAGSGEDGGTDKIDAPPEPTAEDQKAAKKRMAAITHSLRPSA